MSRWTGWQLFPIGLITAMALVFLVNGYMVYVAVEGFPGDAGADGFDLSNHYDKVLDTVSRQAALGWSIDASVDQARRPHLRLANQSGATLPAASIDAEAERPVGPKERTKLAFHTGGGTLYTSDTPLGRGRWDVLLTVVADGQTVTATRRLQVP